MNGLINLSRQLYEIKVTNENLVSKNKELEEKVTINEELIVMTMLSCTELYDCTELYEMVLSNDENVSTCELKEIETFSSNMVTIYANLIKRELKTLEDVPPHIKSEVKELIKND